MIFFLCLRRNPQPIRQYLRTVWPDEAGARIARLHYDELGRFRPRAGLYVFSDTELMEGAERAAAVALHARLRAEPGRFAVWNDPGRTARRLEVLERSRTEGGNTFRAARADEAWPEGLRYPVFLRDEHEHLGPLTPLLKDEAEARAALAGLRAGARPAGPLLVVEYLPFAGADGLFRKYAIFRVGGRMIRKHVIFADGWAVKEPKKGQHDGPERLAEERAFLAGESLPGLEEEARAIFARFGMDYGRMDFCVVNNRIQVFELNSNPILLRPPHFVPVETKRVGSHREFAGRFAAALAEADPEGRPGIARRLWWRAHRPKLNPAPWWRVGRGAGA